MSRLLGRYDSGGCLVLAMWPCVLHPMLEGTSRQWAFTWQTPNCMPGRRMLLQNSTIKCQTVMWHRSLLQSFEFIDGSTDFSRWYFDELPESKVFEASGRSNRIALQCREVLSLPARIVRRMQTRFSRTRFMQWKTAMGNKHWQRYHATEALWSEL